MKVSLSTASLYVYPLRKTFDLAKRAGFDGVELVIGPEVEWRGGEYVKQLSREFALPIFSVHPPLYGFPGWSGINDSLEPYFDRAVKVTRAVDAPLMVVHMPRAKSLNDGIGSRFEKKVVLARQQLNGSGPLLAVENSSKMRAEDGDYVWRSLPDLRGFADAHDLPMTLDTAHIGTWDLDLLSSLNYFDGRVVNIHFSDLRDVPHWVLHAPRLHSYFRQHQFPGSGLLPLRGFLRELDVRGYKGPITYELSPFPLKFWSPRKAEQRLRECVEFVHSAVR